MLCGNLLLQLIEGNSINREEIQGIREVMNLKNMKEMSNMGLKPGSVASRI